MPLDADAVRRGCRGAQVTTAHHLCRAEIDRFRAAAAARRAADRRLHPGSAAVLRGGGGRRAAVRRSPSSTCARPPAGRARAPTAGPKMAALIAAAAEPVPDFPLVSLSSEGVTLIYGRDERAIEAAKLLADHLDVTVLISRPKDLDAAARRPSFRWCKGTIRAAKGHLGAFELTVDDYAAPRPPRAARWHSAGAQRRGVALRPGARSLRRRAAVSRARPARRLSARRPGRSGRRAHRRPEGARSRRRLRQAALHHLHRGPVRAFALAHRRLPPLSRSLPDRRDRARRRSRGDRPEHLRRLRPVRRRVPDRRRRLRAAAGRHAAAQAARAAHHLPRGRRRARDRAAARRAARRSR